MEFELKIISGFIYFMLFHRFTCIFYLQGPLPNTCGHFWEMVWEQRTRGVVMLNRVIEKGSVSQPLIEYGMWLTVHTSSLSDLLCLL